jgi:hypothetical protein
MEVFFMESTEFEKYVNDRYQSQISWYDRQSTINRKTYAWLQSTLLVFSALTPVLIAIDINLNIPDLNYVSIVSAFVVSLTASFLKVFKFQEHWIDYRSTCEALKKEFYLYRSGAFDYSRASDQEALFIERVESIISQEGSKWLVTVNKERDQQGKSL